MTSQGHPRVILQAGDRTQERRDGGGDRSSGCSASRKPFSSCSSTRRMSRRSSSGQRCGGSAAGWMRAGGVVLKGASGAVGSGRAQGRGTRAGGEAARRTRSKLGSAFDACPVDEHVAAALGSPVTARTREGGRRHDEAGDPTDEEGSPRTRGSPSPWCSRRPLWVTTSRRARAPRRRLTGRSSALALATGHRSRRRCSPTASASPSARPRTLACF